MPPFQGFLFEEEMSYSRGQKLCIEKWKLRYPWAGVHIPGSVLIGLVGPITSSRSSATGLMDEALYQQLHPVAAL